MAFRSNEEQADGYRRAIGKLLGRGLDESVREASRQVLDDLIAKYGPVIDCYPYWHPLVADNDEHSSPVTIPGDRCGYTGLDHTVFLRDAFITCPYSDGTAVIESVERIDEHDVTRGIASITAEKIDAQLYNAQAQPVLVKCEWHRSLNRDRTIPTALAVPLFLEKELPSWRDAQVAETWKTMCPYVLGQPCGNRSSLFVNEETGQKLKSIWNALINSGMYGPVREGSW